MPECRYCSGDFSRQGVKTHETYCDEREERFRGDPPGIEDLPGDQLRLGAAICNRSQTLTEDERSAFADHIHDSRRTNS